MLTDLRAATDEPPTMTAPAHPDTSAERRVDVSVLVPVRNEAQHIRATVDAMRAQRFPGSFELLFADGRSDDGTREILEEIAAGDPRVRVLDNPDRLTAHGLNVALAAARGDYVARMDAHAFYQPDYIALGVERLRRGGTVWVAGPAVPLGDGPWSRRVALALATGLGTVGSRKWQADSQNGAATERDLDTGVWAGVWHRSTLEQHGGWNPGWPVNQDSELAARVLADGGRIVLVPGMAAEYIPRDDLRSLARQYARYGFYRCKTATRHSNSMRRSHVLAPGLAAATVAAVAAPRPVRYLARAGLAAYALALGASAARAARNGHSARDAAGLPVVGAVMHIAWGYGFIWGCLRHGPPLAALRELARR